MREVCIYTTAGGGHGLGHVKRMHTLARALQGQGVTVVFASSTPGAVETEVSPFPTSAALGLHTIPLRRATCYIVDTKEPITDVTYTTVRGTGARALVRIDHPQATDGTADLVILPGAHFAHAEVQHVLQTFGAGAVCYGPEYALLSPDVVALTPLPWEHRDIDLLYGVGGTDPVHTGAWLWKATESLRREGGGAEQRQGPCGPGKTWAEALQHSRLFVSLFGISVYEALYLQVPVLTLGNSSESIAAGICLDERYGIHYLGEAQSSCPEQGTHICEHIRWAQGRNPSRMPIAVDNGGAERVATAILPLL